MYDKLHRLSFQFFDANASGPIIKAVTGGEVARRMLEEACPMAEQKLVELMQSGDLQVEGRSAIEIVKAVIGSKLTLQAEQKHYSVEELTAKRKRIEHELKLIRGEIPSNTPPPDASDDTKPDGS